MIFVIIRIKFDLSYTRYIYFEKNTTLIHVICKINHMCVGWDKNVEDADHELPDKLSISLSMRYPNQLKVKDVNLKSYLAIFFK